MKVKPVRSSRALLALCAFLLLFPGDRLWAGVSYAPSYLSIQLPKREAEFAVTNNSDETLAFQVALIPWDPRRQHEPGRGMMDISPFRALVYPPMALVQPGASQTFRILWRGKPVELPDFYRLAVRYQSSSTPAGPVQDGISLALGYNLPVAIFAANAKPEIRVIGAGVVDGQVYVRLQNNGDAPARISRYQWEQGDGGRLNFRIYPGVAGDYNIGRRGQGKLNLYTDGIGWISVAVE